MTTEKQTNLTPFTMFGAVSYLAIRGPNTLQRKDIDQSGEHHFANAVATVSGVPIANLQTLLIGLGANIDADGVFGAETEEALKQIVGKPDYQIQRGDLAVLCDLVVGHLVAARPPAAADPARPAAEPRRYPSGCRNQRGGRRRTGRTLRPADLLPTRGSRLVNARIG